MHATGQVVAPAETADVGDTAIEQLDVGLATRMVIGQATGLLMARHRLSTGAAARVLETLAAHADDTTGNVAARLVAYHVTAAQAPGDSVSHD
jgi:AmiR/NasT family two-component response regulator